MKRKSRTALLLMLILIISIVASACTKGGNEGNTKKNEEKNNVEQAENTPEPTEEVPDNNGAPPVQDLGGYKFIVADNNVNRWKPQEGSSDLANAILDRIKWVEDTYNVKIELRNHSEDEFSTAVLAGDKYADIIIAPTWEMGRHINGKRIVDMNKIPNLHLEKDYWKEYNTSDLLSYDNRTFGVAAPFANQGDEVWVLAFNKKIIEELGLENPYDLVKNKQWTFQKMLEMEQAAKRDLNGDGVMDSNDRYGLATGHDWDIAVAMYLASGNKIIETASDGTLKYAVNTPKAYETIEMIKKMAKKGDTFFPKNDGEDMDAYVKAFVDNKALFLAYSRGRGVIDPIYEMESDFGFIPMPMGNNTDNYLSWVSHDAPSMAVPVTNKELEKTGIILEALAWKAQEEEKIRMDEIAYTQLRDEDSLEILKQLKNYGVSDLAFIGQQMQGNVHSGLALIPDVGFYNQNLESASKVAEIEEAVNIGLEELALRLKGEFVEPEPDPEEKKKE
ncbi:ABC-type glycerol-3-phosphate transport system substrate-binding protein [Paenibacillus castaneae]|uniref:ABC transporter substrate-binding protein n=1 Tax=Paenibacillus castaneae TaxID=474957 RepID=UPI000C9CA263|nr:ABC transporter substrate-binding protein [Paenibacillus castaneae]NIK75285.1 ABC-type glycerol-3-phosphate transport system substrate-binding protein [Paenibacillus castaneae]